MKCPICGKGKLEKKEYEEVFEYKGRTITIQNYVVYACTICEEKIVPNNEIKNLSHILGAFINKINREEKKE